MEPCYLPLANGVLDLRSRQLLPYDRSYHARWVLPYAYDPKAQCPHWLAFLAESVEEHEARYPQEWTSYCLEWDNPQQRMVWVYGPANTGESVYARTLTSLLSEASATIKPEQLGDYQVATLAPTRIATCTEMEPRTLRTAPP